MLNNKQIPFDGLAGGEAGEMYQRAFQEVMQNIVDPNTDPKKPRSVMVEIKFTPDENRDMASLTVQCKTKLAPSVQAVSRIMLGKDKNSGVVHAMEFNPSKETQDTAAMIASAPQVNQIFK